MSFSRSKTGGWATNEKLSSAQMNSLDIDHANALDKTGDTINAGTIIVSGSGLLLASVDGAVQATTHGGIQSGAVGGIESAVPGGIQLSGGSTDWVAFNPARTRTLITPYIGAQIAGAWTMEASGRWVVGAATTDILNVVLRVHNGATASQVTLRHRGVGGSPSPPAYAQVSRIDNSGIAQTLCSATYLYASASGVTFTDTITLTANNVIDIENYVYVMSIVDMSSAGGNPGTQYYQPVTTFTNIANSRY